MAPPTTSLSPALITSIVAMMAMIFKESAVTDTVAEAATLFAYAGFDPDKIVNIFLAAEKNVVIMLGDVLLLSVLVSLRGTSLSKILSTATSKEGVEKLNSLVLKYGIVEKVTSESKNTTSLTLNRFCVAFAPIVAEVREYLYNNGLLVPLVAPEVCPVKFQFMGAWEVVIAAEADDAYFKFLDVFEVQINKKTTRSEKERWQLLAKTAAKSSRPASKAVLEGVLVPYMKKMAQQKKLAARIAEGEVWEKLALEGEEAARRTE